MRTLDVTGLGDLPGGQIASFATAVSADGSVVVGESSSAASDCCGEAFRWSVETGMMPLGDLPGGFDHFQSSAQGVSADGSVVVGIGSSTHEHQWRAFPLDQRIRFESVVESFPELILPAQRWVCRLMAR